MQSNGNALSVVADNFSGIAFVAARDGSFEHLSPRFYDFTGMDRVLPVGDALRAATHPRDRARVFAQWEASVEAAAPFRSVFRLRRGDGHSQWFCAFARLTGSGGGRVHWFGVCMLMDDLGALQLAAEGEDEDDERKGGGGPPDRVYDIYAWLSALRLGGPGLGELREKLTVAATFATACARLIEVGSPAALAEAREMLGRVSEELVAVGRLIHRAGPSLPSRRTRSGD